MTPLRKTMEGHFHSEDDVRRYLSRAAEIVEDENVPDDLREAAFTAAVSLLSNVQVTFEAVVPGAALLNPNGMR